MNLGEDTQRRIGIWCVVLAIPLFAAWLSAPTVINLIWIKDAQAKVKLLGYAAAQINLHAIPCRNWFDFGYSVDYQTVPGEKPKRGYLCRAIGAEGWTWYPQ